MLADEMAPCLKCHSPDENNSKQKKSLPEGTCTLSELIKHQYVNQFLSEENYYRFILPLNVQYSNFVVIRCKSPFGENPIFQMYHASNKKFLLSAQKQGISIGCNYIISIDKVPQKNEKYVGKLRGNFRNTEFNILDNGEQFDKIDKNNRKHLGYIKIAESSIWSSSQNSKNVLFILPKPEDKSIEKGIRKYQPIEYISKSPSENKLLEDYEEKSHQIQVLKFKKVTTPVEKNKKENKFVAFNESLETNLKNECLKYEKVSENRLNLSIGCPLNLLQGFGFLLAMIENKQA